MSPFTMMLLLTKRPVAPFERMTLLPLKVMVDPLPAVPFEPNQVPVAWLLESCICQVAPVPNVTVPPPLKLLVVTVLKM